MKFLFSTKMLWTACCFLVCLSVGCDSRTAVTPPKIDTSQLKEVGEGVDSGAGSAPGGADVKTPEETSSDSIN